MIELLSIYEYNGKLVESDHQNRKTRFDNMQELDRYRMYLRKKLGRKVFFSYRHEDPA